MIAFDKIGNIIKVCFADTFNIDVVDKINNILISKNLIMDKYLSFESNIENVDGKLMATSLETGDVFEISKEDLVSMNMFGFTRQIFNYLEEEFDLQIPDSEAEKIQTVGDVIEYIKNNQ